MLKKIVEIDYPRPSYTYIIPILVYTLIIPLLVNTVAWHVKIYWSLFWFVDRLHIICTKKSTAVLSTGGGLLNVDTPTKNWKGDRGQSSRSRHSTGEWGITWSKSGSSSVLDSSCRFIDRCNFRVVFNVWILKCYILRY